MDRQVVLWGLGPNGPVSNGLLGPFLYIKKRYLRLQYFRLYFVLKMTKMVVTDPVTILTIVISFNPRNN